MIYFDNAATSWPKPPGVIEAMVHFMEEVGANPGRSGHRLSVEAGRIVYEAREALAELFNIEDPLRIAFGYNVTEGLNLALCGYLRPGDHVITSSMEHNSVMRPLRALEREGVELTVVACSPEGFLDPAHVEAAIQPNTVMVVLNHASNVVGSLLPVAEVGRICRQHDLLLLVDAARRQGPTPLTWRLTALTCWALPVTRRSAARWVPAGFTSAPGWTWNALNPSNGAARAAVRNWRNSRTFYRTCARAVRPTLWDWLAWELGCALCWNKGSKTSAATRIS